MQYENRVLRAAVIRSEYIIIMHVHLAPRRGNADMSCLVVQRPYQYRWRSSFWKGASKVEIKSIHLLDWMVIVLPALARACSQYASMSCSILAWVLVIGRVCSTRRQQLPSMSKYICDVSFFFQINSTSKHSFYFFIDLSC